MSSLKANLYEGMIYIIYKKLQLNCLSWFHTNVSTWCRWVKTINVRREILSHNYLFLLCVLFVEFKSFKPLIFHWSFNIIGIFKKNQKNKKVSETCHIPTMFKLLVFLFVIFVMVCLKWYFSQKNPISDIWQGPEYTFEFTKIYFVLFISFQFTYSWELQLHYSHL